MEYVIIIILIVVIICSAKMGTKQRAVKISKLFDNRESLAPDKFYERFYSETLISKNIVLETLKLLELELDTDLSQLMPEDDFSKNLRFLFEFDSMADVAVIEGVENTFSISITDEEAEKIRTINNLIFFIHSKVKST